MTEINESEWFAFRVRPRHEKTVALALREKGYCEFLPLLRERRKWGNRAQNVEVPLFPGYLFCMAERFALGPVLSTPGVVDVIRSGGTPLPAAKHEIEALQQAASARVSMRPWPYCDIGQRVRIVGGPLAGVSGILVQIQDAKHLVLSVELLRRSVLAEVEAEFVLRQERFAESRTDVRCGGTRRG